MSDQNADRTIGMYSFCADLFSESGELLRLWVPATPDGVYRFSNHAEHRFLSVEACDGQWVIRCAPPAFFKNAGYDLHQKVPLSDKQLLNIECEDRECSLYTERVSGDRMTFHNYTVHHDVEISIGRQSSCDISCNSPWIAAKHAVLARSEGKWNILCLRKEDWVFVNGKRTNAATLKLGDVIYIMGLQIIIGSNFISVNDGDGRAVVSNRILRENLSYHGFYSKYSGEAPTEQPEVFFNRAPRKRLELEPTTITVEGPPLSMANNQIPLMLRMGGSMVMGGTAALAGNFTMLLSSVLFPILTSKYTDKQRQDYERCRDEKYREYLEKKRREIDRACQEEQGILNRKFPPINQVTSQTGLESRLWERRPVDDDFLCLRLGSGNLPLHAAIDYPEKRFELETDYLQEAMYRLVEEPHTLRNAPITVSITENRVCGILGQRKQAIDYVRQLILQTAIYHSYDEVKMVFFLNPAELEQLDFIRYLPHTWDDANNNRFIATTDNEAYKIGEYIQGQLPDNLDDKKELAQIMKQRPYFLVFALDKKLFDSVEFLKTVMQSEENHGISVISVYEDLPKECQQIIRLAESGNHTLTSLQKNGGEDIPFSAETYQTNIHTEISKKLANTKLKSIAKTMELPKMVTFMEMFKAGKIGHLNVLQRWRENDPVKSLAAPVGVGQDGDLFMLDLHEKRQGPHGLVAGMTGSGKSEFLISYILSMAVNFHPDEVAFVLIDYKGGGLAGAFENPLTGVRLPHLVGTITNLDGATIQRSLMSIESELKRRQRVFNEVKSIVNEGTMDIYAYQKLRRVGKVSDPMPHLFIISDEFAELKQQEPEFMDNLISAARIGRSLGIHLILATQKPSGVVNDQILSNSKFRVCLRVQDRSDSQDMLKRPEAAELTDTGRFYLQVGYNEYFAIGQSAWCGAAYEPQDAIVAQKDDAVEFLDTTGQVIAKASPPRRKGSSGKKQIVAVVEYLSELAAQQGIKGRQLWLPELPARLDRNHPVLQKSPSKSSGNMTVSLGLLDDPENLDQIPLRVDFGACGNMLVVGQAGSGKSTFVQNVLLDLVKANGPDELNFYILDFSSRTLKSFARLPHCGAVLFEEESDMLDGFFKLINAQVAQRKHLFSQLGVSTFDEAYAIEKLPLILVVIDNCSGFTTSREGEQLSFKLQSFMKDCVNYGVKYIITCRNLNELNTRARQEISERICLHMKDKYDYSEVLGAKPAILPPEMPGRGMVCRNGRALALQISMRCADRDDASRKSWLNEELEALQKKYKKPSVTARRLPVVAQDAEYASFAAQFQTKRIPLGFSKASGKSVAIPLRQMSMLSIYQGDPNGTVPVLENILYAARREGMDIRILCRAENSCFESTNSKRVNSELYEDALVYKADKASLALLREQLLEELKKRRALLNVFWQEKGIEKLSEEEKYKQSFQYLYANTTPMMVLLESVADFGLGLDLPSTMIYDTILSIAHKRNIYIVGFFEPDDHTRGKEALLYRKFNPDRNILMLGGQLDKQIICEIPDATGKLSAILPYNLGIMAYRGEYHSLIMPCGKLEQMQEDEDDLSIF